jgi:predicted  nucleic acid-binding Zn-ribbon protein
VLVNVADIENVRRELARFDRRMDDMSTSFQKLGSDYEEVSERNGALTLMIEDLEGKVAMLEKEAEERQTREENLRRKVAGLEKDAADKKAKEEERKLQAFWAEKTPEALSK